MSSGRRGETKKGTNGSSSDSERVRESSEASSDGIVLGFEVDRGGWE